MNKPTYNKNETLFDGGNDKHLEKWTEMNMKKKKIKDKYRNQNLTMKKN